MTPSKRPPADRGQGRKSVQGGGKSPVLRVVVTPEIIERARRNGPDWVRAVLMAAPDPE